MFKQWRQRKSDGFTLIELLVVVAIIGILAALLFPAIEGALVKAKATRVGSDGRQVHLALFDENLSRDSLDLSLVWPQENPDPDDYTPEFVTACQDSNEFAKWLISAKVLEGADLSFFSAPGIPPQADEALFKAKNNAWCFVTGLSDDTPAQVPFMFTKNFNLGGGTLDALDETTPLLKGDKTNPMPFGNKLGVVVTKGGRVRVILEKYLIDKTGSDPKIGRELFNPPATINQTLYPNGAPYGYLTPEGKVTGSVGS